MPLNRTALDNLMDTCALSGQAPTLGEVNNLPVARDADVDELREAKSEIIRRGRESANHKLRGENGLARRIAKETSASYRMLFDTDGPKPIDPDTLTPSQLADAIRKRPGG